MKGGTRISSTQKKSPKVSIITVVLNAGQHFERYMADIKPYINADVELIILDGGSTDGTAELLEKYNDQIDYWQSEPDKGIYDAMNKAVKLANGRWFYFLGIDDQLLPGFTTMVADLTENKRLYYADVMHHGKLLNRVYDDYYLTKMNFCHQAMFYPREVFDKYSYNIAYVVYADYVLNLTLWKDPAFRFTHLDHLVASFPEGGFSYHTKDKLFARNRDKLFKRYLTPYAYFRYLNRTIKFWGMLLRLITNG